MSRALDAEVLGIGLWSPRLPGWQEACAILAGTADSPTAALPRPAPALLAPTERRRAPDTVAIGMHVALQACEMARRDARELSSVFASTHGDLPINDYMCATLAATPQLCSPTKFHNSVHNAVSGYWSIGAASTRPSTALTAWEATFAAGLLESLAQVVAEESTVLFVAYDVAARGPLAAVTQSEGMLAAALVLAPVGTDGSRATLRAGLGHGARAAAASFPDRWQELLPANAMLPCIPLFAALAGGAHRLELPVGADAVLRVDVNATVQEHLA